MALSCRAQSRHQIDFSIVVSSSYRNDLGRFSYLRFGISTRTAMDLSFRTNRREREKSMFWLFDTDCTNVHELQWPCHVERSRDISGISRRPDSHRASVEMTWAGFLICVLAFRHGLHKCSRIVMGLSCRAQSRHQIDFSIVVSSSYRNDVRSPTERVLQKWQRGYP
jgi:hypothetical protein